MSQRLGALTALEEWQVWGRCSWLVPDQLTPQMQKNPKVELIIEDGIFTAANAGVTPVKLDARAYMSQCVNNPFDLVLTNG